MRLTIFTSVTGLVARFALPGGRGLHMGFDIAQRDPWLCIGIFFVAVAQFIYYQMASTLHEMRNRTGRMIEWGVSTRYRAHCHKQARSPWMYYLFWICLAVGIECVVYSVFTLHR